jgi:hypothetical protein
MDNGLMMWGGWVIGVLSNEMMGLIMMVFGFARLKSGVCHLS